MFSNILVCICFIFDVRQYQKQNQDIEIH